MITVQQLYNLNAALLASIDGSVETGGVIDRIFDLVNTTLFDHLIPTILGSDILLAGVVLLALALVLEIVSGLIDMVVYTAIAGGIALIGGALIISVF